MSRESFFSHFNNATSNLSDSFYAKKIHINGAITPKFVFFSHFFSLTIPLDDINLDITFHFHANDCSIKSFQPIKVRIQASIWCVRNKVVL